MTHRLVIVSNRVPLPSSSTLSGGMSPLLQSALEGNRPVLWFGWSGRVSDEPGSVVSLWRRGPVTFVGIDLSPIQYEGYLNGFAHGALWPLLHGVAERVRFQADDLALYRGVNGLFAARLAPLLKPDDEIWIHDYHLIPLGWMLRQSGVEAPVGFFLHVPFPRPETLLAWPWHRKLAVDFSAYDLVGFQAEEDRRNFEEFRRRARRPGGRGRIARPASATFPVGIHTRSLRDMALSPATTTKALRLGQSLGYRPVLVSAGRLDYTSGVLERFRAFELMLETWPGARRALHLVEVTAPGRELVAGYLEFQMEQQALAQAVNARFGEGGWMPIYDLRTALHRRPLAALFRLGRVGLATPLCARGGLMAREYVAAQDPRDPGVLVVSRGAHAGETLDGALEVDPDDTARYAETLKCALRMSLDERQDRWRSMMVKLIHHDGARWYEDFRAALVASHRAAAQARLAQDIESLVSATGAGALPVPSRMGLG